MPYSRQAFFGYSENGECLRASLINALYSVGHDSAAETILLYCRILVRIIAEAHCCIEKNLSLFRLCKEDVSLLDGTEKELKAKKQDVFLVRVKGSEEDGGEIDHVVVVDAGRGIVLDLVEKVALRLKSEVFTGCLGRGSISTEEAETRRPEIQKTGKGKKNRQMSRAKRQEEEMRKPVRSVEKLGFKRRKKLIGLTMTSKV